MKYFSYSNENGFEYHVHYSDAIKSCQDLIDMYRTDAYDGWAEDVDSVCCGIITRHAFAVDTDNDSCDYTLDLITERFK